MGDESDALTAIGEGSDEDICMHCTLDACGTDDCPIADDED